jgi:hypothetical protein
MRREVKVSFSDKHALDRTIMGVMTRAGLNIERVNGSDLKMFMFKVIYNWLGLVDCQKPEELRVLDKLSPASTASDIMADFMKPTQEKS